MIGLVTKSFKSSLNCSWYSRNSLALIVFTNSRMSSSGKGLAAVIQMTSTNDKKKNLQTAQKLIHEAKSRGALMAFLPEAFDYIAESSKQAREFAESLEGPTIQSYQELATKLNMALSLGGFHQASGDKIKNTHVLISSDGLIKQTYSKIHMYDVDIPGKVHLQESKYVVPGDELGYPVATEIGNVGLSICYDMRFPELSLTLSRRGANILTYPSAFTIPTGYAHWESILRTRAIENQCYVIAAAQTGKHNEKRSSYGHSMIIDPWGTVIAQAGEGEGIALAEINLDYVDKVKQSMPVNSHRRNDLYGLASKGSFTPDIQFKEDFKFGPNALIPANCLVMESPLSVVAVNRKPVLPGHLLVIPKRREVQRMCHLNADEVADFFMTVQIAQKLTEVENNASASTVSIQDGKDARQSIPHLHVHILPRKPGDFQRDDEIYHKIEEHDKGSNIQWRSYEEMANEADKYRQTLKSLKF